LNHIISRLRFVRARNLLQVQSRNITCNLSVFYR